MREVTRSSTTATQRNSAWAAHVYLGWLPDLAVHRTPQSCRSITRL